MAAYQHERLDDARDQIRLIRLLPDLHAKIAIRCEIATYDLSDAPSYQALSYEWGDPEPLRELRVNSCQPFYIRQNLWLFLDTLRKSEKNSALLWIDQICIDQAHSSERNHQVQLMGKIYSKAKRVLAWLGPSAGFRTDIFSALEEHEYNEDIYGFGPACKEDLCAVCSYRAECVRMEKEGYVKARRLTLMDISESSYWTRLWILQENALARSVTYFIGSRYFDRLVLHEYFDRLWYPDLSDSSVPNAGFLINLTTPGLLGTDQSLDQVIQRFAWSGLQCTIPHDLVFGLLGMLDEAQRIPIDYLQSTSALFGQVLDLIVSGETLAMTINADLKSYGDSLWSVLCGLWSDLDAPPRWYIWLDTISQEPYLGIRDVSMQNLLCCLVDLQNRGLSKDKWSTAELVCITRAIIMSTDLPCMAIATEKFHWEDSMVKPQHRVGMINRLPRANLPTWLEAVTGSRELRNEHYKPVAWSTIIAPGWDPVTIDEYRKLEHDNLSDSDSSIIHGTSMA